MDCSRFEQILAGLAEGKPDDAEPHLRGCPACRQLLSAALGQTDLLPRGAADELARSILDRTSGSICPRVESQLWDYCAGRLPPEDTALMTLHVDRCPGCQSLAAAVADAQQALPTMAGIEPDDSFAGDVVAATVRQVDVYARFRSWLDCMIKRPNSALEAAYAGTLLLLLVFSSPLLPFWNRAFDRVSSRAFEPSAYFLTSAWTEASGIVSAGLHKTASAAAWQARAASGLLWEAAAKCREAPQRLGREAGDLRMRFRRGAAAVLSRVSGFVP